MLFPKHVKLVEVGPRDGLQNEKNIIATETKIELISKLSATGLKTIEATSFVSPEWVPQLADGEQVLKGLLATDDIAYPVLVPNQKGLERALASGAKQIAVLCSASELFSQKNTHCSIEQSLQRIEAIYAIASERRIPVRAYLSCCLGCPYEGKVSFKKVHQIALHLHQLGCYEISLGDTIGVGTPNQVKSLIATLSRDIPTEKLAVHFHDTYGQALVNIYASLELGIQTIDCSISGLGGCPYATGASGNVATEDVVYLLDGLEIDTGVSLDELLRVTEFVSQLTQRPPNSKVALARLGTCV